jgi:hypothetical protein
MEVSGQFHALAALPPRKERLHPLDGKLGDNESLSGHCGEEKTLAPPGIEARSSRPSLVAVLTDFWALQRWKVLRNSVMKIHAGVEALPHVFETLAAMKVCLVDRWKQPMA